MDINTNKLKKMLLEFKVRELQLLGIRVPGGYLKAELLEKYRNLSKIWNGIIHITNSSRI